MRASGGRWILSKTDRYFMTWSNGAKCHGAYIRSLPTWRGARCMERDLLTEGMSCGLRRVERLMRLESLKARARRRRLQSDLGKRQATAVAANVLNRTCASSALNRQMDCGIHICSDTRGWLYVAAVIDLFSRCVVG